MWGAESVKYPHGRYLSERSLSHKISEIRTFGRNKKPTLWFLLGFWNVISLCDVCFCGLGLMYFVGSFCRIRSILNYLTFIPRVKISEWEWGVYAITVLNTFLAIIWWYRRFQYIFYNSEASIKYEINNNLINKK